MKKINEYYKIPTAPKWRKIGDTILLGCSSLSIAVMNLPLTDNQIKWVVFSINVVGIAGKLISNLFKEEEK